MKKAEIKVGGKYLAKVNGTIVTVRVDKIRDNTRFAGLADYDVTNLKTGLKTTFRSAAKFRGEAKERLTKAQAVSVPEPAGTVLAFDAEARGETGEDEQGSDPTTTDSPTKTFSGSRSTARATSGLVAKLAAKEAEADTAPHVVVIARAGTGKTTTLVEGLKRVKGIPSALTPSPQQKAVWDAMELSKGKAQTICFVAFNKAIAEELKKRVPPGCDAMTMHSMGYRAVRSAFGRAEPNEWRVRDIIGELTGKDARDLRRQRPEFLTAVEKLVGLCKMNLTPLTGDVGDDNEALEALADYYDVDTNHSRSEIFALVPRVLERCKDVAKDGKIDFDDMIWLPVVLNLSVTRYDLLLVDEAQDLNRCQQALAKRAGRRLILCGDPRQAIYGFAGADADSIPRMIRELSEDGRIVLEDAYNRLEKPGRGCVTLPLTVTRRCGKAIVDEARRIVSDFEAFPANGPGSIRMARYTLLGPGHERTGATDGREEYTTLVQPEDFILCRVNAPLVSQCFRFLKAGRKATIRGRDIANGLVSTVKKLSRDGQSSIPELTGRIDDWLTKESEKEQAKRNPSEARLIALQDRADCLHCFCEDAATVDDVLRKIESVFSDKTAGVGILLSSIHKAKGLEAKRVFLLQPEGATVPHPMAKGAWQREQEMNLLYVAITRAIEELVYVS